MTPQKRFSPTRPWLYFYEFEFLPQMEVMEGKKIMCIRNYRFKTSQSHDLEVSVPRSVWRRMKENVKVERPCLKLESENAGPVSHLIPLTGMCGTAYVILLLKTVSSNVWKRLIQ